MKNFFEIHDYTKNMKSRIVIFSLKGKAYILLADVKHVRGIREDELIWNELIETL